MENIEKMAEELNRVEREVADLLSKLGQLTPVFEQLQETNAGLTATNAKLGEATAGIVGATESLQRLIAGLEMVVTMLKQSDLQGLNQKVEDIQQSCGQLGDKISALESQAVESVKASKISHSVLQSEIRTRFVWLWVALGGLIGAAGIQLVLAMW